MFPSGSDFSEVIDKIYFEPIRMVIRRVDAVQSPIRCGGFLDRSVQRLGGAFFAGQPRIIFYLNDSIDDQLIDETEITIIQSGPGARSPGTMTGATADGTGPVINGSVLAPNVELVPGAVPAVWQSDLVALVSGRGGAYNLTNDMVGIRNGINAAIGINGTNGSSGAAGDHGIRNGINGTYGINGTNGIDSAGGSSALTNGINGTNGSSGAAGDHGTRYGIPFMNGINGTNGINGMNGIDSVGGSPALTNGNNVTNGSNRTIGVNGTGSHHGLTNGTHGTNADNH